MKRLIAAVSFAVLSVPALAAEVGAPYEQTQFDRGLYNAEQNASSGSNTSDNRVWQNDHNFIAPAQ
jgi:opacity protein-like surface antigen